MKKLIRIFIKTLIVLIVCIITLDVTTSYLKYRSYYNQEEVQHPVLESNHTNYSVEYLDNSTHVMNEFNDKVKVLYWHSGCPGSILWFPRIKKIADDNPDSLDVFFITEQSTDKLGLLLKTENIHICRGAGRKDEKVFKHSSSSHIVILDKSNSLKAYGYQLNESDSIIKALTNNRSLSPSLSEGLRFVENEFQIGLKNHDNYNFKVTGFDEHLKSSAKSGINCFDYVNHPIYRIYQFLMRIPDYRIIDLTGGNIKSKSPQDKYCVHYKTKTPFAPYIWQIFFDNKEKRRQVFVDDIQKRLDMEFGFISDVVLKVTPTLILGKITPNEENQFEKLPQKGGYLSDFSPVGDTIRWNYNLKTDIKSITSSIEGVLKMPVQTEYKSSDSYHIILSFLNNKRFTKDEIIKDLRRQGLSLNIENRVVEYLEIKNAADNTQYSKKR
jgi:hypothetical protein